MDTTSAPVVVGIVDKQPGTLRFAIGQARATRRPLRVVHAVGMPAGAAPFHEGIGEDDELREAGRAVLADARQLVAEEAAGLEVHYDLSTDSPLVALRHAALHAGVVVLGSDDVPWYDRLTRTRIAGDLAQHASCPVVVVPDTSDPEPYDGDVVLTIDGETTAEGPIRFAFEEADARDGVLHVLHATPPGTLAADADGIRASLAEVLAGWSERFPDVHLVTSLAVDQPKEAVTRATDRAGLVIVGRPHGHPPLAVLRPLAMDVIRRAHCPVAVVPASYAGA
ncbi:MAG: universal stress protein [Aeromicrobium sp.]